MKRGAAEAKTVRVCELCHREANVYCDSDAAFLCFQCDSKVHNANFLVARHLRRLLCRLCRFNLAGSPFSGRRTPSSIRQAAATCRSCCSPDKLDLDVDDPLSSSSTLSTTEMSSCTDAPQTGGSRERSTMTAARSFEAMGAFENWLKRLGLNEHLRGVASSRAKHALGCLCSGRMGKAVLPFRVSLAASFWFGVRFCGDTSASTLHNLKKVEQLSGVPAKVIVAVEVKLEHVLRARRRFVQPRHDLEEGWAEC